MSKISKQEINQIKKSENPIRAFLDVEAKKVMSAQDHPKAVKLKIREELNELQRMIFA